MRPFDPLDRSFSGHRLSVEKLFVPTNDPDYVSAVLLDEFNGDRVSVRADGSVAIGKCHLTRCQVRGMVSEARALAR